MYRLTPIFMFLLFFGILFFPGSTGAARMDREETFNFSVDPTVTKQDNNYVITFTSSGNCDATVAIVDKNNVVVRHLASGVLGANAPAPFTQNALSQSLVWDGFKDNGQAAPESCIVKVSLGLKVNYDKDFADFSTFNTSGKIGMCLDEAGNLYTVQSGTIRRFSASGAYDRTILPPQASVTPETFAGRPWYKTKWGDDAMRVADWTNAFPNFASIYGTIGGPVVGYDGRIALMLNPNSRSQLNQLHIFGTDGSLPSTSSILIGEHGQWPGNYNGHFQFDNMESHEDGSGINYMAVSPDRKWFYLSGVGNAVLRYRWTDLKGPNRMPWQIFKGDTVPALTTVDNEHFNIVTGVSCASNGDVYIADNGNRRIQVYDSNAVYKRTINCQAIPPQQISVHPETGDIYVLSWQSSSAPGSNGSAVPVKLVKLSSTGTILASMDVDANWYYWFVPYTGMVLDVTSETPAVWLMDKTGIYKVADKGGSFEEVVRLGADRNKDYFVGARHINLTRTVVDRVREEVYLGVAGWPIIRIDGRTGKIDKTWNLTSGVSEIAVGPDGMIYQREGGGLNGNYGKYVTRYNHDATPAPFAYGVPFGNEGPYKGKTAIFTGVYGWSNVFQMGFDVSPAGEIGLIAHEFQPAWLNAVFPRGRTSTVPVCSLDQTGLSEISNRLTPLENTFSDRGYACLVEVWNNDGSEKCIDAFLPPNGMTGLKMTKSGALYTTAPWTIPGVSGPESAPTASVFELGTILKLGLKEDECPRAISNQGTAISPAGQFVTWRYSWVVNDVSWSAQDATAPSPGVSCACGHERFEVDAFERSWLPANHIHSVLVYDANGNSILRVGRYGNADCRGPGSLVSTPDIGLCQINSVAASDEALYIVDPGNSRTLRARLGYEKEVALNLDGTLNTAVSVHASNRKFALHQNVPNPFRPSTTIGYELPGKSKVVLSVYNVAGKLVQRVAVGVQDAGVHQMKLECGKWSSGMYVYELNAGTFVSRKTMALIR